MIQNAAATVLIGVWKFDHFTPVMKELYWLPLQYKITLKFFYYFTKLCFAHQYIMYIRCNLSNFSLSILFPEYDALAKVIQQHPDRHETLK